MNAFQMFSLMVLFELGSAIVIAIGIDAKQGAWLAILLSLSAGMMMFYVYFYLYKQYPDQPLTGYLQHILGKYIGGLVGVLYMLYFFYIAARVLRDFGDLLLSSTLAETPLFVINLLMICTIMYVIYLGIEVLARTGEFYILLLLLLGFVANLLILFSGIIDVKNLLPILGEGWKPIIQTAFPVGFTFPFGEIVVFSMLLPYLNKPKSALRVGLTALVVSGLTIAFNTSLNIAVLGVDIASRTTFPLLTSVGKIRVGEFLERLDALVVITLVIGMFFKIAIFMYAGIIGITKLFNVNNHQHLVFPIGIIILFSSLSIASNFSEHLEEGLNIVPYYLHLPFQIYIPLLLFLLTLIRKKFLKHN